MLRLSELLVTVLSIAWLVWVYRLTTIATAGLRQTHTRPWRDLTLSEEDVRLLRRLHIRP